MFDGLGREKSDEMGFGADLEHAQDCSVPESLFRLLTDREFFNSPAERLLTLEGDIQIGDCRFVTDNRQKYNQYELLIGANVETIGSYLANLKLNISPVRRPNLPTK